MPEPIHTPAKRTCILVLGMHRSGTSAITGTLVKLGVAGPNTPYLNGPDNPRGHWESVPMIAFHDRLLAAAGTSWNDIHPIDQAWFTTDTAKPFYDEAKLLLAQEFSDFPLFVFKDPRICRFLPFWQEIMDRENIEIKVIIPIRNPVEVALSLRNRDRFSITRGLMLWLCHVLEAEAATRFRQRVIIDWSNFNKDWRFEIARACGRLDITLSEHDESDYRIIDQFLKKDTAVIFESDSKINFDDPMHDWFYRCYSLISDLAEQDGDLKKFSKLEKLRSSYFYAEQAFRPLIADMQALIDEQHKRLTSPADT